MRKIEKAPNPDRVLQQAGLRLTKQRQALAALLFDGMHKHMTAEQVFAAACRRRMPVSLATVYNTLHQFMAAGLLREVVVDSARAYFDTNTGAHHHFFDEASGHLIDVPKGDVRIARLPAPPAGRKIGRVDVIIRIGKNTAKAVPSRDA